LATTRWRIVHDDDTQGGILASASGRTFGPGDWLNLPPPLEGTVWRVLAVEGEEGYDGRLIVGDPRSRESLEARA
jgi:hypothetical protein